MKAVIATLNAPFPDLWPNFCGIVRENFPKIDGLTLQRGPGCWNIGVSTTCDTEKDFQDVMNTFTGCLTIARWSSVPESDNGVKSGQWEDLR